MGLLDDAIREHLELKLRRGADPHEVKRQEQEALGPVRREPEPEAPFDAEVGAGAPGDVSEAPTAYREPAEAYHYDSEGPVASEEPAELPTAYDYEEAGPLSSEESAEAPTAYDYDEQGPMASEESAEPATEYDYRTEGPMASDESAADATADEPAAPAREEPSTEPPTELAPLADSWSDPDDRVLHRHEEPEPPPPAEGPAGYEGPRGPGGSVPASAFDATEEWGFEDEEDEEPQGKTDPAGSEPDPLEQTPEFLSDTPEHDRLWFEQKPPRDFDFDG